MAVTRTYFMLMVGDMDRAVSFYRDVVGLGVRLSSPGWSELTHGDATVALHKGGDGAPKDTGLGFDVDDVDAMCAAARTGGGTVTIEPMDRPEEGIRLAGLRDPEGNQFFFSQPLPRPV